MTDLHRLPIVALWLALGLTLATGCATTSPTQRSEETQAALTGETYDQDHIVNEARTFFGGATEGLADVVTRTFEDHGNPNAYIVGEEASGAIGVGLRYGRGELHVPGREPLPVFWQGVSVGFDAGGNASRCFILIYDLDDVDALFQRFPGVEGSLYFVAGVGVTYLQSDKIVIAPIRSGLGWRQGANIGYLKMTREETVNPF